MTNHIDTAAERAKLAELEARTWIEMKAKLRKAMGWPDRRSWTDDERAQVAERFKISVDYKRSVFTASDQSK